MHLPSLLKRLDFFGSPIPGFNIDGQTSARTAVGGCLSIITFYSTLLFGLSKFEDMILRKNPTIN